MSLFCSIIISVLAFFVHLAALSWRSCGSSVWGAWLFLRMLTAGPLYLTEGPYAHLLVDWAQSLPASGAFLTLAGHTFQWTLVDSLGILSSDPAHAPSASSCTDSGFTQFWWLLVVHPHLLGFSTFIEDTMSVRFVVNFVSFFLFCYKSIVFTILLHLFLCGCFKRSKIILSPSWCLIDK